MVLQLTSLHPTIYDRSLVTLFLGNGRITLNDMIWNDNFLPCWLFLRRTITNYHSYLNYFRVTNLELFIGISSSVLSAPLIDTRINAWICIFYTSFEKSFFLPIILTADFHLLSAIFNFSVMELWSTRKFQTEDLAIILHYWNKARKNIMLQERRSKRWRERIMHFGCWSLLWFRSSSAIMIPGPTLSSKNFIC